MSSSYALEEYFVTYLKTIRKISQTSINHYLDAINWISRYLREKKLISDMLYEVLDLEELDNLRQILGADPEFAAMNKRGHQMYSAGLNNYIRFARGEKFEIIRERGAYLDKPVPVPELVEQAETVKWKRSSIIRNQAIAAAEYICEVDSEHETFLAERTGHPYMEGHHVIPMAKQGDFDTSIDVYANLVCVCPICHRMLHYGQAEAKHRILNKFYCERAERLARSGIYLGHDEFMKKAMDRSTL